jgi:hypothetical protein
MKRIVPIIPLIILFVVILLEGCATSKSTRFSSKLLNNQGVVAITKKRYPPKRPTDVAFYAPQQKPNQPYRVIGMAKVFKRSLLGATKSEQELHETIKKLAASIGGDAVMNFHDTGRSLEGHVIKFEKIVL